MRMISVTFALALAGSATASTITLNPSRDTTLYQTGDGSISNGSGIHIFAGETAGASLRRALLAFDIASRIPPGSQITQVVLRLNISQAAPGQQGMQLHPVLTSWGEGSSNAGTLRDGVGAPAAPNDATWLHTFYPNRFWSRAGGDFDATVDGAVSGGTGTISFLSTAGMVARVQGWLDQPATNFGWIIIGNEGQPKTAKRFDSREIVPSTTRPALIVDFVAPPPQRGDANGDGFITTADIFFLINFLFSSGPPPVGSGDANADGSVTVSDVFYLVNFLFTGGPAPPP